MKKYDPQTISKIYVCGTPKMQQTFDMAFSSEEFRDYGFTRDQILIL